VVAPAVSEGALDIVPAYWLDLRAADLKTPTQWQQQIAYQQSNGVYAAAADPHASPAAYIGCEGRLGYITLSEAGAFSVETPWTADQAKAEPFTYVWAIWADPKLARHVYFGGGDGSLRRAQ
jgi:hypothetical protein